MARTIRVLCRLGTISEAEREARDYMRKVHEWCEEAGYDLRAILEVEHLPAWLDDAR